MSLGENIYRHRTEKNWSQGDFAEALDVSRQSISKWENNLATPDLDKLIKMSALFGITLDELVLGTQTRAETTPTQATPIQVSSVAAVPSIRHIVGISMLMFGLLFFLLSVFWGHNLAFGEEVGELLSSMIVLISLFMLEPYNFVVMAICGILYFAYSLLCYGIMDVSSIANGIFVFFASFVVLIWFIIWGLHANKEG